MENRLEAVLMELCKRANEYHAKNKHSSNSPAQMVWNVVTALRGPDFEAPLNLKLYTTARMRAILGCDETSTGAFCRPKPLTATQIFTRNNLLITHRGDSDHFRMHFRTAMRYLKTLGYDVPNAELRY